MWHPSLSPVTANLVSPPTSPPLPFALEIKKNDENDKFDEKKILKLVPKLFVPKAKTLLSEFNKRGNELTWDSEGILFIDGVSIPNSNMFILFPNLFKKNCNFKLTGATELVAKIDQMGLKDFLPKSSLNDAKTINYEKRNSPTPEKEIVKNEQWWYLGP